MKEPLVDSVYRKIPPIVMVYPNGLHDSEQVYAQVSQALEKANIDCIVIEGHTALSKQPSSQSRTKVINSPELSSIKYTIVIPIYNEVDTIPELYRRLTNVMSGLGEPYELIFINDGSNDQSLELLLSLCNLDTNVRVINLTRNFGHQRAISAGLDYARGQAVIVMDGDLQDPPEVIPDFINKWREDFQVVYAIREKRKEHFLKRFLYHTFYLILQGISRTDMPLDAGDFCLMDRCVVNELTALPERNRFVRGLRSWVGFRQVGLAYERDARFAGKSKFTLKKLVSLALDGLISFSYLPLRLATMLGLGVSILSLLAAVYYVSLKLTVGLQPPGFATLTVLLLFLGGVQMITVGIIGEYIGHILEEVKGRPTYVVQQVVEHQNLERS
jgi:glycosyltransferase involved in cell wall biosynthesis